MSRLWDIYGPQIYKCQVLISGVREALKVDPFERSVKYLELIFADLLQSVHPLAVVNLAEWRVEGQLPHRHELETVKLDISSSHLVIYVHHALLKAIQAETILHRLTAVIFIIGLAMQKSKSSRLSILCELSDVAELPSIGFSSSRDDNFLIPDPGFVFSAGYAPFRAMVSANFISWADRKPMVIWRGSTTGIMQQRSPDRGRFSWLQRLELCDKLQAGPHAAICDVGISDIVQIHDDALVQEIVQAGILRERVDKKDFLKFKFAIDIDGNSNAWSGLFEAVLLGCCILKVASVNGYKQWYYDKLTPWTHFVPVRPDLLDINDLVQWCLENDAACEQISLNSREIGSRLAYDKEMEIIARKLSKLMESDPYLYKAAADDPMRFI